MEPALNIFVNGISGVFAGMLVLYLTIKLLPIVVGWLPDKETASE